MKGRSIEKENKVGVQLVWSRNGINWKRHTKRPIFLTTGIRGTYNWGAPLIS